MSWRSTQLRRLGGVGVLDQVADAGLAVLTDGGVQADRLPAGPQQLLDLVRCPVQLHRQLLRGRLPAEPLMHVPLDPAQLAEHLQHMHRQPDRAGRVGEPALDRLADPPHRVGGELVALGVVELLDRPDQAQVAFLHHVEQRQPAVAVLLGHRDHQPEVGLQHVGLGAAAVLGHQLQLPAVVLGQVRLGFELVLREQPGLDPLGQVHLLLGGEQAGTADGLEVGVDRIPHGRGLIVQIDLGAAPGAACVALRDLAQGGLAQRRGLRLGGVQAVEPDNLGNLMGGGFCGLRSLHVILARSYPAGGSCWPIAQVNSGFGQICQDLPALRGGKARRREGGAKLGLGQVPALDKLVHVRRDNPERGFPRMCSSARGTSPSWARAARCA